MAQVFEIESSLEVVDEQQLVLPNSNSPEIGDEAFWSSKMGRAENIIVTLQFYAVEIPHIAKNVLIFATLLASPLAVTYLLANLPKEVACVSVGGGFGVVVAMALISTVRHK